METKEVIVVEIDDSPDKQKTRVSTKETLKILELTAKGVTRREVAELTQRSLKTVQAIVNSNKGLLESVQNAQHFRQLRSTFLNAGEYKLLKSVMDDDVIDRAALKDRAYTFTQIYNARRLEEGKSTSNVASHHTVGDADLSKYETSDD